MSSLKNDKNVYNVDGRLINTMSLLSHYQGNMATIYSVKCTIHNTFSTVVYLTINQSVNHV